MIYECGFRCLETVSVYRGVDLCVCVLERVNGETFLRFRGNGLRVGDRFCRVCLTFDII